MSSIQDQMTSPAFLTSLNTSNPEGQPFIVLQLSRWIPEKFQNFIKLPMFFSKITGSPVIISPHSPESTQIRLGMHVASNVQRLFQYFKLACVFLLLLQSRVYIIKAGRTFPFTVSSTGLLSFALKANLMEGWGETLQRIPCFLKVHGWASLVFPQLCHTLGWTHSEESPSHNGWDYPVYTKSVPTHFPSFPPSRLQPPSHLKKI